MDRYHEKRRAVAATIDAFVTSPLDQEFSELPGAIVQAIARVDTTHMDKAIQTSEGGITFNVDNEEILRLAPGGDIFVKGRLVVNDLAVVDAFREFVQRALLADGKSKPKQE